MNDGRDVWVVPGGLTRVALPAKQPGRELEPGRRLEGHVGPRRRRRAGQRGVTPTAAGAVTAAADAVAGTHARPACPSRTPNSSSSNEQHRGSPVLSRIAESLYWIGRYVERAEDTARLLDVHYHLLLEDRRADEAAVCRALLDAMGADEAAIGAEPNAATVTALLAQDLTFSGSITCSVGAAWENARGAREAMSSELWETLNTTYREVGSRARAGDRSRASRVLRLGARPRGRVQRASSTRR